MPGKGTSVIAVRLPRDLISAITTTLERRNRNSKDKAWTFSDFLRMAIAEKVAKMDRSRGKKTTTVTVSNPEDWIGDQAKLKVPDEVGVVETSMD